MKKILFAIAIVLTLGYTANAQGRDGFFSSWDNNNNRDPEWNTTDFIVPNSALGNNNDVNAPLGSGLLVLTALGAGYAVARKKSKK